MNPPPLPIASGSAPVRVFLVEDSQAVRELLVTNLSDIPGLEFSGYSDSEGEALLQLQQNNFDVVIFDIELKQGNGISLLRSLKSPGTRPSFLKVIFSNNVSTAYRKVGEQYGVRYFFDKTSDLPALRRLLEQVCRGAPPG